MRLLLAGDGQVHAFVISWENGRSGVVVLNRDLGDLSRRRVFCATRFFGAPVGSCVRHLLSLLSTSIVYLYTLTHTRFFLDVFSTSSQNSSHMKTVSFFVSCPAKKTRASACLATRRALGNCTTKLTKRVLQLPGTSWVIGFTSATKPLGLRQTVFVLRSSCVMPQTRYIVLRLQTAAL